ncbi:MAG: GntR family transcriptional regulator [Paracoccaceae bacterium]
MALKSINTRRRRLADEVYDQLIEAIMNQQIGAHDRLVQEKLAAELQISRTPVREALMRLETEGVLEATRSGGFRLVQMKEDEVKNLYEARAAIEAQSAWLLAGRADRATLDALRSLIAREEDLTNPTTRDYFAANRNIHRAFVEVTGNRILLEMFDNIWGRAMAFHAFATLQNVEIAKSLGDHLALVDHIAAGDPAAAHNAFICHIEDGLDLQIAGLRMEQD